MLHFFLWPLLGLTLFACKPVAHEPNGETHSAPQSQIAQPFEPALGHYRAWLECPGGEIAFSLELVKANSGDHWQGWIENGPERERIGSVRMEDEELVMRFDPYGSFIRASSSKSGDELRGQWTRDLGQGKVTRLPFRAVRGDQPRYPAFLLRGVPHDRIKPRYKVQFSEDKHHSVGLFKFDTNTRRVDGTFLTTLGDYRYLSGVLNGGTITLSTFDGAHAFLFKAKIQPDGTLQGDFWSRDVWHETWTASPDSDVTLPDPFGLTRFVGGVPLEKLAFPDVEGQTRSLADPEFAGKARVIVLLGTWCPNCNDLTKYLVELHQRYAAKGLSILGLAFEFGDDPQRHTQAVQRYIEHHAVPYPILIAGPHNKQKAAKIFPVLDQVMAYPTTLFLDAEGNVQAVYTGFSGPATGTHHQKLRDAFERRIDTLLAGQD